MKNIYDLFSVKGKKAIVTGVSSPSGLMYACAEALIEGGAQVTIVDVSDRCYSAAKDLGATPLIADLSQLDSVQTVVLRSLEAMGDVDILINGAGFINFNNAENFTFDDYRKVMMINLDAAFVLCQNAGQHMLTKGYGKIINICSINSYVNTTKVIPYGVSKAALARLTTGLGEEWASKGINVNGIAPGYMKTEFTTDVWGVPERSSSVLMHIPANRWGTPSDIKGATIFLSSRASDYVTGIILPVDGGYLSY